MKAPLSLLLAALACGLAPLRAQDDPRGQAQNYFEDDKATEATAVLAAAAAKNPSDRVLAAMLYASVRDHVWHPLQVPIISLEGEITALYFNGNGKLVTAGSSSGEVFVCAVEEQGAAAEPKRIGLKLEGGAVGLAFSKDSQRLVMAAKSGPLRIWDLAAGKVVYEGPAPKAEVVGFVASGKSDLAAIGLADGTIQVVDLAAVKAVTTILVPGGELTAFAFARSGLRIAAGCQDRRARVWEARTGLAVGAGVTHEGTIRSLGFSYDDRYVLSAGDDGTARLSNYDEDVEVMPGMKCGAKIKKVMASHGGSTFATLLEDDSVLFWDAFTGQQLPTILNEQGHLNGFAWTYSGLRSVTASEDGTATLWTMRHGTRRGEQVRHGSPVRIIVTNPPASRFVATGTADGKVRVWRTGSGVPLPTVRSHAARANTAFYSLDGQHLITASDDRTALQWISGQVRPFGPALKMPGAVSCAVFDQQAKRIVTGDETGAVQVWTVATGKPDGPPLKHPAPIRWVSTHADGRHIVVASGPNAYVYDLDDRSKPVTVLNHGGTEPSEIKTTRFSIDGKLFATGSTDGTVHIWDGNTFKPIGEPIVRGFPVLCVRFSPDGKRLVVAGEDQQAAVYDTTTWKLIGVPVVTTGPVFSAAFTEDGKFIVLASLLLDTVRFFEVETGRGLGEGIEVGAQALSVDHHIPDRVVVVACEDGTVRAFETPFVNEDVPAWFPPLVEHLIGLRQVGPDQFEAIASSQAEIQALVPPGVADGQGDFARLVKWKFTFDNTRHGMPRFVSTLAENIEQRVEERSVDALFECYEAISVDPLVLGAISLYLPNPHQGEYIADLSLSLPNATPLSRCFAAGTLINAGRSQEAEAIAHKALADAPNDVHVLRRVAKLEARFSNKAKAMELFEKALALEPDNAETRRAYGWALYNFHQPAEAAAQFLLAQDYAGDTVEDLIAGICLCAAAQGDQIEAQAAYARLVALDPEWKHADHLTELKGWTQRELQALEIVRQAAFPNN